MVQLEEDNFPKTPRDEQEKIEREARRIKKLADFAARYHCKVAIYNHRGWFGMVDSELAIIHRLEQIGVKNVGMVYNFSHSRDSLHDDAKNFAPLWQKMRPYVLAVNVVGLSEIHDVVLPSAGDYEISMMRTIQNSGWRGPIGVIGGLGPGDAEQNLRDNLVGINWLAAEISRPGSGGPRPFPP